MSDWNEIKRPFREALIAAFNWDRLALVLIYHCDRRLDHITAKTVGFERNVDDVIEDALRNGWLEDLAKGALEENPDYTGVYIQLLNVARQLERIADHATNIAEDVIYLIEGDIVRHAGGNDAKSKDFDRRR